MKVRFFDKASKQFVESLERPTWAKVIRAVELLEKFGNELTMPHSRKVGPNLFELRVSGDQAVRIFYTFHEPGAVLLHGFVKKSRRTPRRELKKAMQKLALL